MCFFDVKFCEFWHMHRFMCQLTITLIIQNKFHQPKNTPVLLSWVKPSPSTSSPEITDMFLNFIHFNNKINICYCKEFKIYTLVHKFKSQCVPHSFTNSIHSKLINIIVYVLLYNFLHVQFINHLYIFKCMSSILF